MTQLALPTVIARYVIRGAGPRGGSAFRFDKWLDRWRGNDSVRLLVARDSSEVIVVPVDLELERDQATGYYRWRLGG
jgi:hypothetical protein